MHTWTMTIKICSSLLYIFTTKYRLKQTPCLSLLEWREKWRTNMRNVSLRIGQNPYLFFTLLSVSLIGLIYLVYNPNSNIRPDVGTTTLWLAPIVWERTFDLKMIDSIYKPQNLTVATTLFALGKYVRFLKDLLESAEQHFMVGYRVHYYLFTDLPDQVPMVKLGEGRQLIVIKTESSNRWQEISIRRMERIEKLIEEELISKADYMFSLDVDSKFYAHWGAESLGDLVGVVHAWFIGKSRHSFSYERRPESLAFIPYDEGDYYYGGAVFGGRPDKVLRLVKTCRMNLDLDRANQIEAVWQEESHLNKYFLYNKPTKLLSPEYLWDDSKWRPSFMKVVRFTQVLKNYAEIRPNP